MEQVTSITMWQNALPALFVVMMRFRVSGLYGAEHGPSTVRMDAGTEAARVKDTSAQESRMIGARSIMQGDSIAQRWEPARG